MITPWLRSRDGPYSVAEFSRLPEEDEHRVELVSGWLVREPRPGARHGLLAAELVARLHAHAAERGLGRVVTETGFLLVDEPPTVRGPDAAFIAAEHLPAEGVPEGFWRVPPDLAVEVVSPSNTRPEIRQKALEYLEVGTALVWVVDPGDETVTVYRSWNRVRVAARGEILGGGEVLPGFRLAVSELFED